MKRKITAMLCAALISTSMQSQSASRLLGGGDPFAEQGTSSVNLYYGMSLSTSIYKAVVSANASNTKYSGIGPIGIMYEYLVADNIGLGAEFGYTSFKVSYDYESFDSNLNTVTYTDSWQFNTIRAMFRANFHFTHTENFDAYGFVSAGYRGTTFNFTTTDPNLQVNNSFKNLIPFGFKPGIGLRYFVTDNLGFNMEFALGNPLICGGISARF
jgi:opacity protein-like surface antigen